MKFVLNVRHRPEAQETIEARFAHFVEVVRGLPSPWGFLPGKSPALPPVGSGLSTTAQLRGKLGTGVAGQVTFAFRAAASLRDHAAVDDACVIEFEARKSDWWQVARVAVTGYVQAMGAYLACVYRWDEAPAEWRLRKSLSERIGNRSIDGRDGLFRIYPISFMDRELCRRGCNGMTPEQIVTELSGVVPEVRLLGDGVLIVAADHYPDQAEIIATDRSIRDRLGLPIWT
jgi:hypothetical protein